MADGVPAADVYKVLGTPEGVDRAFKKLDTIKKDIVWWEAGAQPPQLLAEWPGRDHIGMERPHLQCDEDDGKPFKIIWISRASNWDCGRSQGHTEGRGSLPFISFASQPGPMAEQTKYISYGPGHKDAIPNIAPDVLADLPTCSGQ